MFDGESLQVELSVVNYWPQESVRFWCIMQGELLGSPAGTISTMPSLSNCTVFKIASFARNTRGNKKLMIVVKVAILGSSQGLKNKGNRHL